MRKLLLTFLISISLSCFAQKQFLTELKIDSTTKIIGRYPQYDKNQTYKNYNFILDNPKNITEALILLTFGDEYQNTVENPDFSIVVVQNNKETERFTINPRQGSVRFNGHTYAFNLDILKDLAKKHPFEYKCEKIVFSNPTDYTLYLEKQKRNPDYLFDYAPQFKYEGVFEIEFPRTDKFSSPKAICDYANPIIKKIVSKNDYNISYVLNDKNKKDQSQFTMTIRGPKKLFDKLEIDNFKKMNWKNTIEEGYFFYRIK